MPANHDYHLTHWLKAEFDLTVEIDTAGYGFYVYKGDYVAPGDNYGHDRTSFMAAMDYAVCNEELYDTLDAIEAGRA